MKQDNETVQRILDSTQKIFILKEYQGTTTEDITRDANVDNAALNYYFPDIDNFMINSSTCIQ